MTGEFFTVTPDGFRKMTDEEVAAMSDEERNRRECDHPNIIFEDDVYDEHGRRISKHCWYCPDCDFLQVG